MLEHDPRFLDRQPLLMKIGVVAQFQELADLVAECPPPVGALLMLAQLGALDRQVREERFVQEEPLGRVFHQKGRLGEELAPQCLPPWGGQGDVGQGAAGLKEAAGHLE